MALAVRAMYLYRWGMALLQAATCLAECARAFADEHPELAGVLQGATYAAFRRASPAPKATNALTSRPPESRTGFHQGTIPALVTATGGFRWRQQVQGRWRVILPGGGPIDYLPAKDQELLSTAEDVTNQDLEALSAKAGVLADLFPAAVATP